MSFENILRECDLIIKQCVKGAEIAYKVNNGAPLSNMILKACLAAFGTGLFAAICGASFTGTCFLAAVVAAGSFGYMSYHYTINLTGVNSIDAGLTSWIEWMMN